MRCCKIPGGIIHLVDTEYKCPYCEAIHDSDLLMGRWERQKKGWLKVRCRECRYAFGFTFNFTGDAVAFPLEENIL